MVIVNLKRVRRQLQLFSVNAISHYMRGQMNDFAFRIIYHTIKVKQITGGAKLILNSRYKISQLIISNLVYGTSTSGILMPSDV